MAMENMRNPPLGQDIIEISDDEEDDNVIDLGSPPRQDRHLFEEDEVGYGDLDNDDLMLGFADIFNHDEPQRGFLPNLPQLDQARRPGRIPNQDPIADPDLSLDRQQGQKRPRRDGSSPEHPPLRAAKRLIIVDSPPQRIQQQAAAQQGFFGLGQDIPMFEPNFGDGQNGFMPIVNGLPAAPVPAAPAAPAAPKVEEDTEQQCLLGVLAIFPDVSPDYVNNLWRTKLECRTVEAMINFILQEGDEGRPYTKVVKELPAAKLKKKQILEIANNEEARYSAANREVEDYDYQKDCKKILSFEFPWITMKTIDDKLYLNKHFLFPTYMALYDLERQDIKLPKLKTARKLPVFLRKENVERATNGSLVTPEPLLRLLRELKVAKAAKIRLMAKYDAENQNEKQERENEEQARALGAMDECGCCFSEYPLNRMIHCSNVGALHYFCKTCARTNAETEVGQGKYILVCMSMNGCSAGFSREQRDLFLDDKLKIALERIETEHSLRMAGIENLESCPFCPFAAEYPPVEEDRIFRCIHPDCGVESCRLCKKVSHIPKTCDEFAREAGADAQRRRLEDAMSEALVKKCNKCKTPFIKSDGCNKITCTKCRNIQCYICSEDCVATATGGTYAHFNDPSRGGKAGQCQLFDDTETRHQEVVNAAQKAAIAKIQAEFPGYTEEELKINETAAEKEDRERRAARDPLAARYAGMMGGLYGRIYALPPPPDGRNMRVMLGQVRAEQAERVLAEPALVENRDFQQLNADVEAELDRMMAAHRAIEVQRNELVAAAPEQHIYGAAAPRVDDHGRGNAIAGIPEPGEYVPLQVQQLHNVFAGPYAMSHLGFPEAMNFPFDPLVDDPSNIQRPGGGEVRQPPPPPPPPFDPAKAAAQEVKAAQDRAIRDAYLRAPPAVQARRRDQMRRMMKDPNLDDAAVERAILRGGTPVKKKEGREATPERQAREQGHAILDRFQNRREAAQPPQPRRANRTPSPQRAVAQLQTVGQQMGVPIEPDHVPAVLDIPRREGARILQPERLIEDERREHQDAASLYADRRGRIINRLGLLRAGVPPVRAAPVQEAPAAAPGHGEQPRGMFAHMRQALQQVGRNAFQEFVPPHLRAGQAPVEEADVAQVNDIAEAPFDPFMEAICHADEMPIEGAARPEGQLPLPQEPAIAFPVIAGPDGLRQALLPGPVIMAPAARALDLPVIDDEVALRRLRIRRELDERSRGPRDAAGAGFVRRRQIRDLERQMRGLEMQFMQVIRRHQACFGPAAQPLVEVGVPYAGDWDADEYDIFQNMLPGGDSPHSIAQLGPRQAAILGRVNRRLGGQVGAARVAPAVPREGPLERQYLENLARRNRDRERNVAERARAEVRDKAVVRLSVGHVRRRAAEVDTAQPRPGEEAIPARIDELRQMVAALRGNVEEPVDANAAWPIVAPHAAELPDLNVIRDARAHFWARRYPPAQVSAEARPGNFVVGNEGRLGELPQQPGRAERAAQRMDELAAADGFWAIANGVDRTREGAVGLGDDPFLAPAGHIVGLPPHNRGLKLFEAPLPPLLAPKVDANAQQPDVARLSGGLPGSVALNLKRPRKGAYNAAAGDGEKEQARPGADAGGGQGNNAGCGGFIGSAMRRVMSLRPRRETQEVQPSAARESNAPRRSVSLRGILRPRVRDTPADEEPNGDDVFQSRAGSGDALHDGPQLFRHNALARQRRLSNGAAAAVRARPPQMQREDSGDEINDGHQGSPQHLPAQRPPFRPPVWRPHSDRAGANGPQPALPVPVQALDGAALMQWLTDDSGESSDDSMAAQSAGRFVRQPKQARVDKGDEVKHPDPVLALPSSPLKMLNLGMRRAFIGDGEEADGAASQQSRFGDVEMGENNQNNLEEDEVEEEL